MQPTREVGDALADGIEFNHFCFGTAVLGPRMIPARPYSGRPVQAAASVPIQSQKATNPNTNTVHATTAMTAAAPNKARTTVRNPRPTWPASPRFPARRGRTDDSEIRDMPSACDGKGPASSSATHAVRRARIPARTVRTFPFRRRKPPQRTSNSPTSTVSSLPSSRRVTTWSFCRAVPQPVLRRSVSVVPPVTICWRSPK